MSIHTLFYSLLVLAAFYTSPTPAQINAGFKEASDDHPLTLPAQGERIAVRDRLPSSLIEWLTPPSPDLPERTPIGRGWRHDFDRVLTREGRTRIVFDADGERLTFVPSEGQEIRYDAAVPADGSLIRSEELYRWRRPDGQIVTFEGSIPISIQTAAGARVDLDHEDGRLIRARSSDGSTRHFHYHEDRLVRITDDGGARLELSLNDDASLDLRASSARIRSSRRQDYQLGDHLLDRLSVPPGDGPGDDPGGDPGGMPGIEPGDPLNECRPDEPQADSRCDPISHPPPARFSESSGIPGAIRVDARPGSCRSYFEDYTGTTRGSAIENGLNGLPHYSGYTSTVRSFPIVDFIGDEFRVVRSRDLALSSYNSVQPGSESSLFDRLIRDGQDVQRYFLEPLARDGQVSVTEQGQNTTLAAGDVRPVVLELVVRHGMASADQIAQIHRARIALQDRFGIELRVVEIP